MTTAAESFAWCILQVTILTTAALLAYVILRRQSAPRNVLLLSSSLAMVMALTLACWSPWPHWDVKAISQLMVPPSYATDGRLEMTSVTSPLHDPHFGRKPSTDVLELDVPTISVMTSAAEKRDEHSWWRIAMFAAWTISFIGIARLLMGMMIAHRYRRKSVSIDNDELRAVLDQLVQVMGIRPPVDVREVASLDVAATIGWRRPIVLLPKDWRSWSADQRRAVLAHELSHISQRHFPLWLTGQLAVAPHFYHPLVHWLVRRLRLELELSADAQAARAFGDRRKYAGALAELAIGPRTPTTAMTPLGLFMSRPLLMRRISMLRQSTHEDRSPARIVNSIGLITLTAVALVVVGLRGNANSAAMGSESSDATVDSPTKTENQQKSATRNGGSPADEVATADNSAEDVQTVTSLIQVSRHAPAAAIVPEANLNSDAEWQVFCRTQLAFLKSSFVLQAALRDPAIADLPMVRAEDNPLRWLKSNLQVGFVDASEIMQVSMTAGADEVESLRKTVDAVVKAYINECVTEEQQQKLVARDTLSDSLAKLQREIAVKYEQYLGLAKELNIVPDANGRDAGSELLLREIADLGKAKTDLQLLLMKSQQDFMVGKQRLNDASIAEDVLDEKVKSDPNLSMLNQQLLEVQFKLMQEHSNTSADTHNAERLEKQADALRKQVENYRAQLELQLKDRQASQPDRELEAITKEFQIRSDLLQNQIRSLEVSIAEKAEKLMAKSERSVDLEVRKAELEQLRDIARDMSTKLQMMDIAATAPARIRVIQPAM
jgi:beta-lactamase regulating signal transducer with metallopeptidase domain